MAFTEDGSEELRAALEVMGVHVNESSGTSGQPQLALSWDDRRVIMTVTRASQMTGARARELVEGATEGLVAVVADRVTADAREVLNAAGWSWLDLRGHLRLRGGGLLIDTAVAPGGRPAAQLAQSPLRGKAGLAVAYWLCGHPDEALSPTGHSADLGFAPSTISAAAAALAEGGLVDEHRRAVLPELFWELAAVWRPQWTWLASLPKPTDMSDAEHGTSWVITGDRVAAEYGAPLGSAGTGPLELFVPGPVSITVAARRYGVAPPGTGVAAVAIGPVRQVFSGTGGDRLDGWRTAPVLAVALGLAGDPARGREILEGWPGEGHVWL